MSDWIFKEGARGSVYVEREGDPILDRILIGFMGSDVVVQVTRRGEAMRSTRVEASVLAELLRRNGWEVKEPKGTG